MLCMHIGCCHITHTYPAINKQKQTANCIFLSLACQSDNNNIVIIRDKGAVDRHSLSIVCDVTRYTSVT